MVNTRQALNIFYLVLYVAGCCSGVALAIYGFLQWKTLGFPIIGSRYSFSYKTPGSEWLMACIIGIGFSMYCLFGAMNLAPYFRRGEPSDSDDSHLTNR